MLSSGAYQLKLGPVPVNTLIADVAGHLQRQFDEKGIRVETILPDGLPPILADKDRITQVLTNLVGNALQYTSLGGTVTISASGGPKEVEIAVQDTGIGIAPQHIHHIFERFYRADKSRTRAGGGSGIGLTIAQALVNAHQGRIWVESAGEGKGSTFHFTVPISSS